MNSDVLSIDLTNVIMQVCKKTGMEEEMAVRAEAQYRQYLALRSQYPQMILVPPKLADELWHEHILQNEKYVSDCEKIFGSYLEHHVGDPQDILDEGWENTKRLFDQEFGVSLIATGETAAGCR